MKIRDATTSRSREIYKVVITLFIKSIKKIILYIVIFITLILLDNFKGSSGAALRTRNGFHQIIKLRVESSRFIPPLLHFLQ